MGVLFKTSTDSCALTGKISALSCRLSRSHPTHKMAATAPASAPKGAKKAAKKPSVDHPSYDVMIVQAIKALDEKKGCSRQVIVKYIGSNNKVPDKFENRITLALKRMVKKGTLSHTKGRGASGSFCVTEAKSKKAKKPASKPKKVKKPAAVKKAVKPKSPTKKKSPAKSTKSPAKKAKKEKKEKKAAPVKKPAPAKAKKIAKKKSSKKGKPSKK